MLKGLVTERVARCTDEEGIQEIYVIWKVDSSGKHMNNATHDMKHLHLQPQPIHSLHIWYGELIGLGFKGLKRIPSNIF